MRESSFYQAILEEGREEGIQQGIEQGVRQVAKNLLTLGISLEQVAEATGLSVEVLQVLQAEGASSNAPANGAEERSLQ